MPTERSPMDPCRPLDGPDGLEGAPSTSGPKPPLFERLRAEGPRGTRYQVQGELGRGGMGAVLEVWDPELQRKLAMKVILGHPASAAAQGTPAGTDGRGAPPPADVDPRILSRFLEEAQITGQLDHPGIVPVHELGLDSNGRVYFTMRLVRGVDLRAVFDYVQSGHEGWNQVRALNVLLRVCEAVAFAHSKQVIHRDLKPANVMVGRFGEVVVMDWGLARVLGREDHHDLRLQQAPPSDQSLVRTERHESVSHRPDSPLLTMDGDVVGTPSFMPPEQARGDLERLGPHSDVYSIGAMLYQLLTGTMPYEPKGARVSAHLILMAALHGPPPPLESLAPRTSPELVAICEKAMAREIAERYPSTEALAADLRAYLEGRVVAAYETGTWAETRKWVQRNKPLAGSLAAAALAIATGLVGFGLKAREARAAAALARAHAAAEEEAKNVALQEQRRATELRDAAVARADALWTIQELKEFQREAHAAEFAWALQRPGLSWWLETARRLIDGQQAAPSAGVPARPGLADHQRLLARIRGLANPPLASELDGAGRRITWTFDDREKRWWNEQLTALESDLLRLQSQVAVAERGAMGAQAARLWAEAKAAIREHAQYGGLELGPQLFLWPLGPDPASGLWEFAHLLTGEPAVRGADQKLVLGAETGVVFVLLPGGRVPVEEGVETGPWNQVDLAPFFLSKYELTRAQWERIAPGWTGRFEGNFKGSSPLHPADSVSWDDCTEFLGRLPGWLDLPSQVQWEYGCRAGTTTPWWTGADEASLAGSAWINLQWEDGPAAIGLLRANPFGLHDVHGNIWEWCRDAELGPNTSSFTLRPEDGLYDTEGAPPRVFRGGAFAGDASFARSSARYGESPVFRFGYSGLRPRQCLTP